MTEINVDFTVARNAGGRIIVQLLDSGGVNPRTDLAGWTGHMQVRAERSPDATLLCEADVEIDTATGTVTGRILPADTEAADWVTGEYDLLIVNGADDTDREPLAYGTVSLRESTTVIP